jgi:hypothetical protein
MNTAFDVHLVAYVHILIIMAKWCMTLTLYDKGQLPEVGVSSFWESCLTAKNRLSELRLDQRYSSDGGNT